MNYFKPAISCKNLSVGYLSEVVLEDVNLSIHPGMFLPFVGPNGAGKTTLLRTILGLIPPIRGKVTSPFRNGPPGYVPQQKSIDPLYPVSVKQIVCMGFYRQLGWWKRLSPDHKERLNSVLERFNLIDHAHKTYGALSGGMKQKVLIARAMVSGADVFIMDEPASDLDAKSETEVLYHLHRLCQEEGKTVLMAHHGIDHLADLSDTVCLVHRGSAKLIRTDDILTEWQLHNDFPNL